MSDELTLRQASRQSGVEMSGILEAIRSGALDTVVTSDGRRLIPSEALHAFLHPITGRKIPNPQTALGKATLSVSSSSAPAALEREERACHDTQSEHSVVVQADPEPVVTKQPEPVQVPPAAEFEARSHPVAVHPEQILDQMNQLASWCQDSIKQLQALDQELFKASQKLAWQEIRDRNR